MRADHNALTLVTGATGQTGRYVVEALRKEQIPFRAFVRSAEKAEGIGISAAERFVGDLRESTAVEAALQGCTRVIMAAGASPNMEISDGGARSFRFPAGQRPEDIDYRAALDLVRLAQDRSVQRVVLVSSAGVTDPNHRLNQLDGSNLLKWKLMAEEQLRQSGLPHVIIRPGRLLNAAQGGDRNLCVDPEDRHAGAVLRSDVAAICVAALQDSSLPSLTFNLYAEPGEPTSDVNALIRTLVPST